MQVCPVDGPADLVTFQMDSQEDQEDQEVPVVQAVHRQMVLHPNNRK